jgi:DNA-binding NtrC family response regulator
MEFALPDTIQIVRNGFHAEDLDQITAVLEEDGHRCALLEGRKDIDLALSNPRSKLLLVGVGNGEVSHLAEVINLNRGNAEVPLLVYFGQPDSHPLDDVLKPEIDDFLFAPLALHDLRIRVSRLTQGFSSAEGIGRARPFSQISLNQVDSVRQRLLAYFAGQNFIGSAPLFLATIEKIPSVASCDASVLLVGDTGTGKELCSRSIHYLSSRADKPFVPVNCGAIPADLFENEMFGHESGAFTDARQSRRGLIAETEGGTLFLDEVDSLAPSAQVKLLRFLQERQYRPLGGHYRHADVRVIAATNQNLNAKVQQGTFREDLFYRLKVVTLRLPELRNRREDISPLAAHFLRMAAQEYNRPVKKLSAGAVQKLTSYTWPGNVRELENVIRQAVVMAAAPIIRARDLELGIETLDSSETLFAESLKTAKARVVEEFERTYLEEMLLVCQGNISKAARRARKDRRSFFALLKKYGLTPDQRLEERTGSVAFNNCGAF